MRVFTTREQSCENLALRGCLLHTLPPPALKPRFGKEYGFMFSVLIVDDNESYRESLRNAFSQQFTDMLVVEAENLVQALEQVEEISPDFVFIDLELAGESGLELARSIRTNHADINIAILTNYDIPEYRQAAKDYGANFFFSKASSTIDDILAWIGSTSSAILIP